MLATLPCQRGAWYRRTASSHRNGTLPAHSPLPRAQEKFAQNFLARECRNSKETSDSEAEQVEGVRAAFREQYASLVQAFAYYSASVSAAPFFMGLNEFTAFLDECRIPDNEVAGVKRSDLDTIFIVCTRKARPAPPSASSHAAAVYSRRGVNV